MTANVPLPTDLDDVGAWQLLGFPGLLVEASYLTAPHAAQYRLIVDVLLDQQQHTLTGVSRHDLNRLVRARLAERARDIDDVVDLDLEERMRALVEWSVVDAWQDRAVRDQDFLRNRDRYQLTLRAARLHRAVRSLADEEAVAAAATLAPAVLRAQLTAMRNAMRADPDGVATAWAVVLTTTESMAVAAAGWQSRLAEALAGAPDAEKLATLTDTLRRYVDMWGAGVDVHSEAIAADARELLSVDDSTWRAVALHVVGADAVDVDVAATVARYRDTLATVVRWFDGRSSQARLLRRQVRDTIAPLVRGQRTVAAVGGHVSRRAELLALAARLDAAVDDDEAWTVWVGSSGLFAARHLAGAAPAVPGSGGNVSFWDAAPVPVEARLRRMGPRATTGTAARMADRSAGRAAARHGAALARETASRTRAALLRRSGVPLSMWTAVTPAELDQLVGILAALATVRSRDARREVTTGDGQWQVRSELLGTGSVTVHGEAGRLVCADLRLTLRAGGVGA